MSSSTLAIAAARVAALTLARDPAAQHQCFRVKNLGGDEVVAFIEGWPEIAARYSLQMVRLLVADDLGGRIDARHVADPDLSITHYRNHNQKGLVYIETSTQSDEQGLQNMFSLRDSNFLDGSFDDVVERQGGVTGIVIEEAWNASGGRDSPPAVLEARLLEIVNIVHAFEPVPVRRFVSFAELACSLWHGSEHIIDGPTGDLILGEAIWSLEMFPDAHWNQASGPGRVRRRLEVNLRHAELMDGASELDAAAITARAKHTLFVGSDGKPLDETKARAWRELCVLYAQTLDPSVRRKIPYLIFSQLFSKDTSGLKLGDRVRAEIVNKAPDRVGELDVLDVVSGLNLRSSQDAGRLLEAPAVQKRERLPELLSAATRKAVERLAVPARRRFLNPAILVVRLMQRIRSEAAGAQVAHIQIAPDKSALLGSATHGLFVFLFGSTLRSIAEALSDVPGACQLEVADVLLMPQVPPGPVDQSADEDNAKVDSESEIVSEIAWEPFPFRITILDTAGEVLEIEERISWLPADFAQLALFWFLSVDPDSPALAHLGTLGVEAPGDDDDWLSPVVRRTVDLGVFKPAAAYSDAAAHPLLAELSQLRHQLAADLASHGLDVALLQEFLDEWRQLLDRAREDIVPDGVRGAALEALLSCDMLRVADSDRRLMLPLHPIRLRWICAYLAETQGLADRFLSGQAAFADDEGELYLDWLEHLTPRESPPLTVAVEQGAPLLYSRSQAGWTEEFAPMESGDSDAGTDLPAIASIADRVADYLDAHPYKRDGLSMLIVLPRSDAMPAELLARLARIARGVRVSLHVAVSRERWEAIAREIEKLSEGNARTAGARLFPDRDLSFIDYRPGMELNGLLAGLDLDIAIVTHVLQEQIVSQQNTEPPISRPGANDPLRHRPLRLESRGEGGAISLVMLPRDPDRVLESWSTLVVRANRSRPVAPSQPENTDFVELRVNFQDSARLFRSLHAACHWVITLERHISREQIESIEAGAPDILSIEEGIGSNALSTLVVSSCSGSALIQSRIQRKLERLVPAHQRTGTSASLLTELAAGIYDAARQLAPRLVLQALGVARVTEEIIGLSVARRLADMHFPEVAHGCVCAWISLDEHTAWFGGHMQVRADMCRLTIFRDDSGQPCFDVLVLEGKLRQQYDGHGVIQVRRTCDFFRSVLGGRSQDSEMIDSRMWRNLVASAVETLPSAAVRISLPLDRSNASNDEYRDELLSAFRRMEARLGSIEGMYSACLWESEAPNLEKSEEDNVMVLRSTRAHLLELVDCSPVMPSQGGTADALTLSPENNAGSDAEMIASSVAGPAEKTGVPHIAVPVSSGPSGAGATTATAETSGTPVAPEPVSLVPVLPTVSVLAKQLAVSMHSVIPTVIAPVAVPVLLRKGMTEEELRRIYEVLFGCFSLHGLRVSAASPQDHPCVEGPASILFRVRPGPGIDPRKLYEKASALKLALELDQEQNVSFSIDRGFVTIDVPKRADQRYFVDAEQMWLRWQRPADALSIPLGEDRFGKLVTLDFSSANAPHLLVAGTTGSGKSEALNTILFGLIRHYTSNELRLLLVDPKSTELRPFEGSAYLEGEIGWQDTDAIELLGKAVDEMQRRYTLFREAKVRSLVEFNAAMQTKGQIDDKLPWWLLVLDEYADLTHDPQVKKDVEADLKRLAQKARAAGIHVVIATQKPSAEVISTNLRSNLPVQLALRVKSATESRVVMDEAGAENLNGKGDALLKIDGKLVRVQCARVQPSSFDTILAGR